MPGFVVPVKRRQPHAAGINAVVAHHERFTNPLLTQGGIRRQRAGRDGLEGNLPDNFVLQVQHKVVRGRDRVEVVFWVAGPRPNYSLVEDASRPGIRVPERVLRVMESAPPRGRAAEPRAKPGVRNQVSRLYSNRISEC